jgi:Uri superfamily endonuclease
MGPRGRTFRNELKIDGAPTVERDYENLHVRLLYLKAGVPVPTGDLYDLGTWPRKYVKAAILIAMNARTEHETTHALARELEEVDQKMGRSDIPAAAERLDEVRRLLRDCAAKHKPIAHFFGSDAGVRLMRTDSDLAIAVMLAMQHEGITPLGVHDSFIVPETYGPKLEEVMQAELAKLDQTRQHQMVPNQAPPETDQRVSSKGDYIGVWGDSLVALPRTCGELASAYLGLPF